MTRENLVTFHIRDFVDDVKEVMARKRFRDFPVLGNQGKFVGLVSRRRLLNVKKKQVILVDHNEKIRQSTEWKKQMSWRLSIIIA